MSFPRVLRALVLLPVLAAVSAWPVRAQDQSPVPSPPQSQPAPQPEGQGQDQLPPPKPLILEPSPAPTVQPPPPPPPPSQLPPPEQKIEFHRDEPLKSIEDFSSPYIPLDSWIYPAMMRLYSMGFVGTEYLGLRPWTRLSVVHMLDLSAEHITDSGNDEAIEIYSKVNQELQPDMRIPLDQKFGKVRLESIYTREMVIAGTPLRDSFHLGQTDINDFGRPYASGFNSYNGVSAYATYGRFSAYFRGEYQHAPGWEGYSYNLAENLAYIDGFDTDGAIPLPGNTTIPLGPISSSNKMTVLEGYVSAHLYGHEISFGKMDNWFGPGVGGGMAWSNNAENIWSFRINRVEPWKIPYLSRVIGSVRYDFSVGPLKGHNDPVSPWVHAEQISFKPSPNFEFGFERTVIWGGIGHAPVTLGTFWHSFYSISDTTGEEKYSRNDPGARFSAFNFSWRLPYLTHWLLFYVDSETHDDVFPITAPRRAAYRPGLYLSHFPGAPKLDLRVEAANTAPNHGSNSGGQAMYIEVIQRNGYTNNGQLMGDWIGRENKGGQAWLTYHFSPQQWLQLNYRRDKATRDYIREVGPFGITPPNTTTGGTTQNDFGVSLVKRFGPDVELKTDVQYETWLIPIYKTGRQSDTTATFQLTWYPHTEHRF